MAELFGLHDRARFEVVGFSFGPAPDEATRQLLAGGFDRFEQVAGLADAAIAARARALGIDIAIDLKGYTEGERAGVFARRAAPIQVSYLGYPGTMGAPYIDYLIADRVIVPDGSAPHYSERVVRLPGSYQVNDRRRTIVAPTPPRTALGLPAEGVVFCCFNRAYKLTPETFASWMRILAAVEGSVLWLLEEQPRGSDNLRREAAARGIDPARLVFAAKAPVGEHLARQRAADLFLDTLPCNAHTTASDALWAGLPVVTRCGESFAARVAASLLHAVGLPELVTTTAADYEALAIALARDPARRARLREHLARDPTRLTLFDTPAFARGLEAAFERMHARRMAGLPPEAFDVEG
jgi:predicted O-linked N-acetylglucosamine transferase (SPINDLY family)